MSPSRPVPPVLTAETAAWAVVLTDLKNATTSPEDALVCGRQAVTIAQAGGVTDEALTALLHLAVAGMTPTARRALRDAGIDPDPTDAVVIDRATLPVVEWDEEGEWFAPGGKFRRSDFEPGGFAHDPMIAVRDFLALALDLAAHPTVDEAQVAAVETILTDLALPADRPDPRNLHQLATELVRRGIRMEAPA